MKMQFPKFVLLLCYTCQLISSVVTVYRNHYDYEAADYDFGDDPTTAHYSGYRPDPELKNIERIVMSEMAEDEPQRFNEKEKRVRDALIRSTQDVRNRRTISEVLPILRSLSKQQRLALAALISAKTNAKSNDDLDLKQVEEMFGERRNLILPVIFDIANIVKNLSHEKKHNRFVVPLNDDFGDGMAMDVPAPAKLAPKKSIRSKRSPKYRNEDVASYHEKKLNMTNFRGTHGSRDQQAIESETKIHFSLPNANTSTPTMSLEEIENLAFADLNGTNVAHSMGNNTNANSTIMENLPEPEMLIRPYRVRPRPISERFDNIYLYVADYPINAIMGSIRRHRHAMTALLADNPNEWRIHLEEMEAKKRREDDNNIPSSGMCPSIVRYARPQKARSASGEWKYIVNTGQHTQTLRLEKCTHPEQSCTYLTDNFSSRCAQIYNYHRLLSWDNQRGLHIDIFKVPTCCSCQIDGYREKFPPIAPHGERDHDIGYDTRFSASDALYSLANNDYNDNENDSEEAPSEQPTSSIFTPIIHHPAYKKQRFDKRRKMKRPSTSNLDAFLTPPNQNKFAEPPSDSFKRKQSSISHSNRASERATNSQPVLIGNDDLPEIVSAPNLGNTERTHKKSSATATNKNGQVQRVTAPSKVLIKRVNYNYHPIIDFFFRDRATSKAASSKAKDSNRVGHSIEA